MVSSGVNPIPSLPSNLPKSLRSTAISQSMNSNWILSLINNLSIVCYKTVPYPPGTPKTSLTSWCMIPRVCLCISMVLLGFTKEREPLDRRVTPDLSVLKGIRLCWLMEFCLEDLLSISITRMCLRSKRRNMLVRPVRRARWMMSISLGSITIWSSCRRRRVIWGSIESPLMSRLCWKI